MFASQLNKRIKQSNINIVEANIRNFNKINKNNRLRLPFVYRRKTNKSSLFSRYKGNPQPNYKYNY